MIKISSPLRAAALAGALLVILGLSAPANAEGAARAPWDGTSVDLFTSLIIQDGGRLKPMDTYAQFTMLRLNGKRTLRLEDEKLKPVPWLLDCIFYPERAADYKQFIVDDSEAISAIGVAIHDKKRDRYSYNELAPGRMKMFQLAGEYSQIDAKLRDRIQQGVLNLASNVMEFEKLYHFMDFAKDRVVVTGETALAKAFPEAEGVPVSVALVRAPAVLQDLRATSATLDQTALDAEVKAFSGMLEHLEQLAGGAQGLAILPPASAEVKEWRSPAEVMGGVFQSVQQPDEAGVQMLSSLEKLYAARDNREAFNQELAQLHGTVKAAAEARGEYAKIPLEVFFYRQQFLFYSQWLFALSFMLIAASWLFKNSPWNMIVTSTAVIIPLILLIVGIAIRCIIRNRPPITTLYETVLFITALAVIMCLVMEFMNRQRIGVAMGAILGVIGMFIAFRYEMMEGVDTMPSLVAVLDTNFWLATHVTIINAGYSAGVLAGALAHVYIVGRLIRWREDDKPFYRNLNRMIYGAVAFCLVFSTVGTILGGIWANDSWGRFWGWDPKENGALMICIWTLVMLHAKMGRYIKDLGVAISSVFLAMIVAFSWWGVNQLGVGLHSYGFTSGIMNALVAFWLLETVLMTLGLVIYLREKSGEQPAHASASGKVARAN
ncbi:MAG: cytochrome c biogenesis protein CcsA [Candidatus Hydrogenedentes bacterium]|nr:cytochrome c biogenesis protein CcsA [Candidatus Hydrogenedentota bacterium]